MDVAHYFEEMDHFLSTYKLKVEDEKKEIAEFSNLLNSISQKATSNSVINSLFKDDQPEGFVFSKYEEKRKELAKQRRAEYNAYLEKKEAERLSKQRGNQEKREMSPKSVLDSIDYERVLAKRKEEEARFRNVNIAGILHHSEPILDKEAKKQFQEKENVQLLEERISKQLEEQRQQILQEFENDIRRNYTIKEELPSLKSHSSVKSSPPRTAKSGAFRRTGGGGEPVKDSLGNLLAVRGQRNTDYSSIQSFPSMQQQPVKDRMALYRKELQKQIEEKKRLEALEQAKAHEQEERVMRRIEEQRQKMLEEYESEVKKSDKTKEKFERQQERIRKLEEFQKRDAEARCRKVPEVLQEVQPPLPIVQERSCSPPIPAVRTRVLLEKAVEAVPKVVKPENPFSSLAEIRRKIMAEQQRPINNLKKSYEVMNRRTVQEISEDEEDELFKTSTDSFQFSA